jgi:hypothetical protein
MKITSISDLDGFLSLRWVSINFQNLYEQKSENRIFPRILFVVRAASKKNVHCIMLVHLATNCDFLKHASSDQRLPMIVVEQRFDGSVMSAEAMLLRQLTIYMDLLRLLSLGVI